MDDVFTMTITEYSKRTRIGINTVRRLLLYSVIVIVKTSSILSSLLSVT